MRVSALVIATILLIPVSLIAQRGGGGVSSGAGHSSGSSGGSFHGGSSGSPESSRSSVSASPSAFPSSQRSNSSTRGSDRSSSGSSSERYSSLSGRSPSERSPKDAAGTGLNIRPNLLKSPVSEKVDEKPEKKSAFSFLHHRKPAPEHAISTNPPFHCKRGQSCRIPVRTVCQTGRVWNSSSCS